MAQLMRDTRFALRMLRKRWGITLVAVASLAIAIGGNTAVFSLVNAVLLQPTSIVAPERVVLVRERLKTQSANLGGFSISAGTWDDLKDHSRVAGSWGALRFAQRGLRRTDRTEPISVSEVTPGFIDLVGSPLRRGRGFRAEEGVEGGAKVAIVRPEFWEREYGGEGDPLGAILTLDGEPHEVVGVLPENYRVLFSGADILVPLVEAAGEASRDRRDLLPLARLAPEATVAAFEAEVAALAQRLEDSHPEVFEGWTLDVLNYADDIPNSQTKIFYALLQGSVFFVLLIACANVTNLLLARGQERQREIAVRLTLGSGRWRIVRQLLTESTLLVAAGMILGLGVGGYGIRLMVNSLAGVLPPSIKIALDGDVLFFTLLISALTGLAFGLAPALQTLKQNQADAVQAGGRSSATRGRKMLSRSLVVAEIALSLIALGGGGALIQSFLQLRGGEPGFDPAPILTAQIRVPPAKYADDRESLLLLDRVLAGASGIAGVESAAAVNTLPRGFATPTSSFQIRGRETEEGSQAPRAFALLATPGYLDTIGIELLQGRFFSSADGIDQAPVAVVNRSFANTWFAGESPLGRYLQVDDQAREIVGVVDDLQQTLAPTPGIQSEAIYTPFAQAPANGYFLTVRARGGAPGLLAEPLREALRGLDQDLTASRILTMDEVTEQNFAGISIFNNILGGFGVLAILLAAVGSYGVLAYSVNQRNKEIGIRMALGAERRSVVWMVARQGVLLAIIGLAIGGLFMVPLIGLIRSLMAGFTTVSSNVAFGVAAVLFVVTVAASLLPARRAARVDPVRALQQE